MDQVQSTLALNDAGGVAEDLPTEGGDSPDPRRSTSDEGLVSTLEAPIPEADTGPEGANNTGDTTDAKGETKEGSPDKDKDTSDGDDTRFDKHPRFQELIAEAKQANERAIRAEARIEALEARGSQGTGTESDDLGYEDITSMSDDEIRDKLDEDPKGFLSDMAKQIHAEVTRDLEHKMTTKSQQDSVMSTLDAYAKENPDFDTMWDTGELKRYMDSHPGHNAISAHMMITSSKKTGDMQSQIDEAVAKAVKETEARVLADVRAKRHAMTLGEGPGSTGRVETGDDKVSGILKDSKKQGGSAMALFKALRARRADQARAG